MKFAAAEEFPFDLLPRADADGGGKGGRDGDVEAWLSADAFDVSVEQRCAVCPAGLGGTNCSRLEEGGQAR